MKVTLLIFGAIASIVCATGRGLKAGDDMVSGKGMMIMGGGGKNGRKRNNGRGGGGGGGTVPSYLRTFFNPSESVNIVAADMSNPWSTPGDMTLVSGPLYGFPEEDPTLLGTIYGTCTILRPTVSDYCHFTAYYDYGEVQGGWTYMGTLFNPVPSVDPPNGPFTIVGTRGDFNAYSGGDIDAYSSVMGNVAQNITFY
jgi:hypothetical protein